MARGWESKSVEEQQADAREAKKEFKVRLTPEQTAKQRHKQSLMLSRSRVLQQLETASSPVHRQMLETALEDLDKQIAQLG
jgi:hypothetical protein